MYKEPISSLARSNHSINASYYLIKSTDLSLERKFQKGENSHTIHSLLYSQYLERAYFTAGNKTTLSESNGILRSPIWIYYTYNFRSNENYKSGFSSNYPTSFRILN